MIKIWLKEYSYVTFLYVGVAAEYAVQRAGLAPPSSALSGSS